MADWLTTHKYRTKFAEKSRLGKKRGRNFVFLDKKQLTHKIWTKGTNEKHNEKTDKPNFEHGKINTRVVFIQLDVQIEHWHVPNEQDQYFKRFCRLNSTTKISKLPSMKSAYFLTLRRKQPKFIYKISKSGQNDLLVKEPPKSDLSYHGPDQNFNCCQGVTFSSTARIKCHFDTVI